MHLRKYFTYAWRHRRVLNLPHKQFVSSATFSAVAASWFQLKYSVYNLQTDKWASCWLLLVENLAEHLEIKSMYSLTYNDMGMRDAVSSLWGMTSCWWGLPCFFWAGPVLRETKGGLGEMLDSSELTSLIFLDSCIKNLLSPTDQRVYTDFYTNSGIVVNQTVLSVQMISSEHWQLLNFAVGVFYYSIWKGEVTLVFVSPV